MTKGDLTLVHQNNIKICTFEEKKKKTKGSSKLQRQQSGKKSWQV